MNNLLYSTQQPDKVGAQVEEKLRKETGATSQIPYQVESSEAEPTTLGTLLGDMGKGLFGGKSNALFTLAFSITTPRAAQLRVTIDRQGVGCHAGMLLYSTQLSKSVKTEVVLDSPKGSKFSGDADAIAQLNAKGDVVKRLTKFSRTQSDLGVLTVKIDRIFKIVPQAAGSMLIVSTLPRMTSMGMDASLDSKDFFELAAMIEAAL